MVVSYIIIYMLNIYMYSFTYSPLRKGLEYYYMHLTGCVMKIEIQHRGTKHSIVILKAHDHSKAYDKN